MVAELTDQNIHSSGLDGAAATGNKRQSSVIRPD